MEGSKGAALLEVIMSVAILAIMSAFLVSAAYTARTGSLQAKGETLLSYMAFAVLENIRAEAGDLDLNGDLRLDDLELTNPNGFEVTITSEQDAALPDLYKVTVRVEEPRGRDRSVTMCTLVRSCY